MNGRLGILLALLLSGNLQSQDLGGDEARVTSSAVGEVRRAAERVTVTVGVEVHDRSAAKAASGATQALEDVLRALEEQGLDRKKLPTTGYSVQPDYDWETEKVRGYAASTGVTVTLEDVSVLGRVIDTALGAGANDISAIEFQLEDARSARDEALGLAFAAAKRDCEVLASAAGSRLGRLVSVKTGRRFGTSSSMETITVSAQSRPPGTRITAPEVVVAAHAEMTWELEPNGP